jgi:hypothetical protein
MSTSIVSRSEKSEAKQCVTGPSFCHSRIEAEAED